jgi:hypothetical protein
MHHQPEKGITKRREGGKSMQGILQMLSALNISAHVHCQLRLYGVMGKEREGKVVGNSTGAWKRTVMCNRWTCTSPAARGIRKKRKGKE